MATLKSILPLAKNLTVSRSKSKVRAPIRERVLELTQAMAYEVKEHYLRWNRPLEYRVIVPRYLRRAMEGPERIQMVDLLRGERNVRVCTSQSGKKYVFPGTNHVAISEDDLVELLSKADRECAQRRRQTKADDRNREGGTSNG